MKITKAKLNSIIQEELSAVLGEAEGETGSNNKEFFLKWMDDYGNDYISGDRTNDAYDQEHYATALAQTMKYYDTGMPDTPYDPNDPEAPYPASWSPASRNQPLIPKTASGDTTPSAAESALPALGLDPDLKKGSITLPKKTFKLPDASNMGDYGDPPDQEPRKGPLTDPPKFDSPKPRQTPPSGPKKTFLPPGFTPVNEQLKQMVREELKNFLES